MTNPINTPSKIHANCKLDVNFDPKNKIIYVCPGKPQYFTATSTKCCGPVTITYTGNKYDPCKNELCGKLGKYSFYNSGIVLHANHCIAPDTMDVLTFTATDGCNSYSFTVLFVYSPCECCNSQNFCHC
ncbi:hypothetical protein NNC19_02650 [Clostridium sp. SHJSY1]|uniref:hypothetical protein n=1 Tax=Clostridium sp. SHJSY1 TaxID=2942483 RepID=UPI002874038C|nr:hypothetical protein [Clostridium sp. SHJSY1]MDS0524561.1 hypothetical protein [Clostridium sp. SHJSY1]